MIARRFFSASLCVMLLTGGLLLCVLFAHNFTSNAAAPAGAAPAALAFASIVVNSNEDANPPVNADGKCTLREALANANADNGAFSDCAAGSGNDVITFTFATNVTTFIDTVAPLNFTSNVALQGVGRNRTILIRSRATGTPEFGVVTIASGVTVTISNLTICNGRLTTGNGAGLNNAGNLTLQNVSVQENNIPADVPNPAGLGGGIYNTGTLALTDNSVLDRNRAGAGAGIYNTGTLTTSDTTLLSNHATEGGGGGIYNAGGTVTLTRTSIVGARAIDVVAPIVSATALRGGALYNSNAGGDITLTNCTIVDCTAEGNGAALYNDGNAGNNSVIEFFSSTIATNNSTAGGAIFLNAGAVVRYRNSIFSHLGTSPATVNFINSGGTLTSLGHNLNSDASGVFNAAGDLTNTDPKLGAVNNFGGSVLTMRLECNSPAINAADASAPATDARNLARIGAPDIGAYEFNYSITTNSPLPPFTLNAPYSQQFATTGGDGIIRWEIASGLLPAGFTLNADTGLLSGTTSATGTFNFTLRATDQSGTGCATTKAFTLTNNNVVCPTITVAPATTALSNATAGTSYAATFTASGGTAPYTFSLAAGDLPLGMSLSSTGALSGIPTLTGTFNFTVQARMSNGCVGTRAYTLSVGCATITAGTAPLPNAQPNRPYLQTLSASGGVAPYFFTLSSGTLPAGITLQEDGTLSGTTQQAGTFNFAVAIEDANGCALVGTKAYQLIVSPCQTITVTNPATANGTINTPFSQTFTQSGGQGTTAFALASGTLPAGLTLNSAGLLSGTPTQSGTFAITVRATDANNCTGTGATYSLMIGGVTCPTITLNPASLAAATCGTATNQTITASGGTGTYTFTLASGTLPTGVTLTTNGTLSGMPTQVGSFALTVRARDANNCTGDRAYTLTVNCQTITVTNPTIASGTVGAAFAQTFTQTSGKTPVSFTLASGTLPTGLTLATTGTLSGTPTQSGTFPITVRARDANNCAGVGATYNLVIGCPTITVTPATLTAITLGQSVNQQFSAAGLTGSFTYAISAGVLPNGVTLSSAGLLSGTPTQAGTFNFTVRATGVGNCSGSVAITLRVNCPTITLAPASLPAGTQGASYSQTLTASGGQASYSYAVTSGALPGGLVLATNGTLSGAPTGTGTFNFTITATDARSCTGTQAYTLVVNPPANTAPSITPVAALARQQGSSVGSAVQVATVTDLQTPAGSLTVAVVAGGTATGVTVTNLVNTNGVITAQVIAACNSTSGTVCLQVSDGALTSKTNLQVNTSANTAPTLSYNVPEPICLTNAATINPATTPGDNGTVSIIAVQSVTPAVSGGAAFTGNVTVNSSGVISVTNAAPVGTYTVALRATDNCGATRDTTLMLNVIGPLLVSEFRFHGPGGAGDWYVELFNVSTTPIDTTGLKLGLLNADGSQVAAIDLTAGRAVAGYGFYLIAGPAYSLASTMTPDQTVSSLPFSTIGGVGIFKGALTDNNRRMDSVATNGVGTGTTYALFREGTPVPALGAATAQHAYVRKSPIAGVQDTANNLDDFVIVSPGGTTINGVVSVIGTPGPRNASSFTRYLPAAQIPTYLLDTGVGTVPPNRVRSTTPAPNAPFGTLAVRRTVLNNTGRTINKLRVRIVDITNNPTGTDGWLQLLNSATAIIATSNGNKEVRSLTLVPPATVPGGRNGVWEVSLPAPLANGQAVNIEMLFGVAREGAFSYTWKYEVITVPQ